MSDEQGIGQTTDSLIQALQGEAIAPRDARVKSMWDLLRQRRLLRRSEWLRNLLRRIWQRGLLARPRPRTTQRLRQLLQQWGILGSADITPLPGYPVVSNTVVVTRGGRRPVRPVVVRPLRPVSVRPLRPVQVRHHTSPVRHAVRRYGR